MLETRTRTVVAIAAGISTLVGLALGALELKNRLFPPHTESVVKATIEPQGNPQRNVSWRSFLAAHPEFGRASSFGAQALERRGFVFTVNLDLLGFGERRATLTWYPVESSGGAPLPQPAFAPTSLQVPTHGKEILVTRDIWIAIPSRGDRLIARFQVRSPEGGIVQVRDTEPPLRFINPP